MRKSTAIATLALLLTAITGCDILARSKAATSQSEAPAAQQEVEIIIPVQAQLPKRGDISAHFETTTRVEAENRVQVVAEGMGECLLVTVEEGDSISEGQILAELDKREMLATIGQTQVQVRQTKTAYDRAASMCEEGLSSEAERDNARFAYEQALATLEMHKVQLSKLTVRAPIAGLLTHKPIQTGQMVSAGTPIFTIVDPTSFMLAINPPEREIGRLELGQEAKVTIDALGNREFQARVRRINPNVDPVSGTVRVILDFEPEVRAKLREAAFARVRLIMNTREDALLVPKDAVLEENARKYVFVVEQDETAADDAQPGSDHEQSQTNDEQQDEIQHEKKPAFTARRIEIETGFEDSNYIEVIEGIDDTALIVVLGQHTLRPGSRVTITNANDEIMARAGLSAQEALEAAKARRQQANDAATTGGRRIPRNR